MKKIDSNHIQGWTISFQLERAINIAIRIGINLILALYFPSYLVLIYLGHNRIFSYDLFSFGSFGIQVIFGLTLLFALLFGAFIAFPMHLLDEAKKSKKKFDWFSVSLSIFGSALIISLILAVAFEGWPIYLALSLSGMLFIGMTYLAFRLQTTAYLGVACIFALICAIVPLYASKATADTLSLAMAVFRIGGGVPVKVTRSPNEQSDKLSVIDGNLVLLGPDYIFLKKNGELLIIPRTDNTLLGFPERTPEK